MAAAALVVCADGLAAQLASGLGARTLALVPARSPQWSFGVGPQAQLWHPTVRIYRADPRGDSRSAMRRLLTDIEAALRT
jgi:hypothetical protein